MLPSTRGRSGCLNLNPVSYLQQSHSRLTLPRSHRRASAVERLAGTSVPSNAVLTPMRDSARRGASGFCPVRCHSLGGMRPSEPSNGSLCVVKQHVDDAVRAALPSSQWPHVVPLVKPQGFIRLRFGEGVRACELSEYHLPARLCRSTVTAYRDVGRRRTSVSPFAWARPCRLLIISIVTGTR